MNKDTINGEIKKIAYVGIDLLFPCLQRLYDCGLEILKIYTCECDNITEFNTEIIGFAENNKIDYTLNRITINDFRVLKDLGCDLLICAGYYYKIPTPVNYDIDYFPMINIHPAKVPEYRGAWPMPIILLNNEKCSEISIFKLAENLDEGDLLLNKSFIISRDDNLATYMQKANIEICNVLPNLISNFYYFYYNAYPQKGLCYNINPTEDMYTITSSMSVYEADNILRAFYGYTCIYRDENKNEIYEIIEGVIYDSSIHNLNKNFNLFSLIDGKIITYRYKQIN